MEAAEAGIIVPTLVGPKAKIAAVAREHSLDIERYSIVDVPHSDQSAARGVELIRETLDESAVRARGLFRPEHVAELLAAPNDHLTTLEGSKLWQVALLECWLQTHGI